MWTSDDEDTTMLISAMRSLQSGLWEKMKNNENCEDRNRQCNMENVLKGHIIPSPKNEIC